MAVEIRNEAELHEVAKKVFDNPDVIDQVKDAVDKMFFDLGFKLKPNEKKQILQRMLSDEGMALGDNNMCAGTGARCCRI